VICAECKREVAEGTRSCPVCGAPVSLQPEATSEPPTGSGDEAVAWHPHSMMASNQPLADAPSSDGLAAPSNSRRGLLVVAVVVVGALVLAGLGAAILVAGLEHSSPHTRAARARQLTEEQLRLGDCLAGSNLSPGTGDILSPGTGDIWSYTASEWPYTVTAVACNHRHLAEVFFTGNLWPASLAAYPGDDAVFSTGEGQCVGLIAGYAGASAVGVGIEFITPDGGDWASGDRLVVCMAYQPGYPLFHSVKATGR
jgi:hypothetical protein